jgi:CheY-like chemotaxis protein
VIEKSVLIAEDEVLVQNMAKAVVEHCGYRCEIVSDGAACLERLAKVPPPALLILDLVMPGVDGIQVLQSLAGTPPEERIPIAVLSGLNQQDAVVRAIQLGADDYIVKPFLVGELKLRINALIFAGDDARARSIVSNLRMADDDLANAIAQVYPKWALHDVYAVPDEDGETCVAIPSRASPLSISKLHVSEFTKSVGVFRKCVGGWRKIWPRFPTAGRKLPGKAS